MEVLGIEVSAANAVQMQNVVDGLKEAAEAVLNRKRSGEVTITLLVQQGTIQSVRLGIERTVKKL
jgi:hypothetical protein